MVEPQLPIPQFYCLRGRKGQMVIVRADTPEELRIQLTKTGWKIIETEKVETHHCGICGSFGAWSQGWAWYGTPEDLHRGTPILETCSEACRREACQRGLVPEEVAIGGDGS